MADSEQARFCSYGLTKRHLSVSDVPVPIPVIPIPVIPIKKNDIANANPLFKRFITY